jgi:hypothetical protein
MLTINDLKIIFFHNKKTAGTSIEAVLSVLCNDKDYISYHKKDFDKFKKKNKLKASQNNLTFIPFFKSSIYNVKYNTILFLRKIFSVKSSHYKKKKFISPVLFFREKNYAHVDPITFFKYKKNKKFKNFTKLSTYRKFSDQLYSMYNHRMKYSKFISYQNFCDKNLENFYQEVIKFYSPKIYLLNFHNLEKSLETLRKKFSISYDLNMLLKKINFRTNYKKYPNKLNTKTLKKLSKKNIYIDNIVRQKLL